MPVCFMYMCVQVIIVLIMCVCIRYKEASTKKEDSSSKPKCHGDKPEGSSIIVKVDKEGSASFKRERYLGVAYTGPKLRISKSVPFCKLQ